MIEFIVIFLVLFISIFILMRHGVGVWLCVAMLPLSGTTLLGHKLLGVAGLNVFNIVFIVTCISFVFSYCGDHVRTPWPSSMKCFWIYVFMFLIYGFVGCFYIHLVPLFPTLDGHLQKMTVPMYFVEYVAKPIFVVAVTFFVAARTRAGHAKEIIWAVACGSAVLVVSVVGYVLASGTNLIVLAGAGSRSFLSWTGLHANSIGLFFNMSIAMLLFPSATSNAMRGKKLLWVLAGGSVVGALLTFSRAAFLGLAVIGVYFLFSRRKIRELCLAIFIMLLCVFLLPDAIFMRATTGLESHDEQAISAGRSTVIWPALVPVFWESPLLGHGVGSTLWAKPNRKVLLFGHPHNAYLAALLDFGIVGSGYVLFFYMLVWRRMRTLSRVCEDGGMRGVFEGASLCILLLVVQGISGQTFTPFVGSSWMWVGVGVTFGYRA